MSYTNLTPQGSGSAAATALGWSAPATSGFVSSAQPQVNQQTQTATTNAANNLVNPGQQPQTQPQGVQQTGTQANTQNGGSNQGTGNTQPTGTDQNGKYDPNSGWGGFMSYATNLISQTTGASANALSNSYNLTLQNAALANQQIGLQYSTALGGLNTQYNQAFQQLQTQHANTVGAAVSQMATADPQGVNTSSFAGGYIGKINDMYNQQATFLTSAYNQQQVALQNGQASAALGIQQSINSANAQFGTQMAGLQQGMATALMGIGQFGVSQENFQQSRLLQSQALFESSLKGSNLAGVDPNATTTQLEMQFPILFQEGQQAGYSSDAVADSIRQGTISYKNSQIAQQNLYLSYARAQAEYGGNALNIGGGSGSNTPSGSTTLSPWAQGIISSSAGGAALSAHPEVLKTLTDMTTAASPQNIQAISDFVNTGNTDKVSSVLGGFLNGLFGANLGNITSSQDLISSGSTYLSKLGIDPKTFSNLANQTPQTRAEVMLGVINNVEGQLMSSGNINSKVYNLSPVAGDLDSAYQSLKTVKQQLTPVAAGGDTSSTGASGGNWQSVYSNSLNALTAWATQATPTQ